MDCTKHLLQIAREARVKRFIHISSEAVVFQPRDLLKIDEGTPLAVDSKFLYVRSKAIAERLVLQANSDDFVTLALRPRLVWGNGDKRLKKIAAMAQNGRFRWIGHGRSLGSTTHILNLVHAIELSLTQGSGGECYFISDGEPIISSHDFLARYASTQGIHLPKKSIPPRVARILASIIEVAWRFLPLRSAPPIARLPVEMMINSCTLNTAKAQRFLGYQPIISIEAGMRDMQKL